MKYQRTTVETIEVVCVYDPEKGPGQHPLIRESCLTGKPYISGSAYFLSDGDWIVKKPLNHYVIPVAEQDGWEEVAE